MPLSIIQIDDILVSSEIITEKFCCDYAVCRGACCIAGESGAPLEESETAEIERDYSSFSHLMSAEARRRVSETGFFEIDGDEDLVTPLLGNSEECVYTRFEDGNCLCAIEKAFGQGLCRFAKPVSCRLYPVRVSTLSNGMKALNLHRWEICKCAFDKGRREGISVYEFLRKPLTDAFGEEFYKALECAAAQLNQKI